ncbi:MDR family MFS transporter [Weissella koreensis]|uniref:MFS transporter n=1 Tax=Weissella koreensis TaxID=165096 RepID=A0A7H1MN66_9LACO|nr:MFS transporter [Weissella koreensis]AVH75700.1 MFS transporter [Weissella koreensis]QGN20921.1 MFS transporter [Weissella koreensis]QNT64902.1 MFS transporter [Weissella koreensis]
MQTTKGMSLKWLLIASFINNFALGFIWPLTSIYLHNQLGQTLITVGWVMLMNAVGQMVGSVISGRLFDRMQPFNLIRIGIGVMALSQVAFILWHGWPAYPIILAVTGIFSGWNTATINSYGTQVRGHDGRYVFNMLYFIANFGMVFATAMVGTIYNYGIVWLFIISFIMYSALFIIIQKFFNFKLEQAQVDDNQNMEKIKLPTWNLRIIWTVILGLSVLWISYAQWQGNLSVYMSDVLHLPLWQYSMLWTINGLLVAVVQLTINFLNLSTNRKMMWIQIYGGIACFGLAFLILPFVDDFKGFALAMVITTLGEATAFPMIPALVNELTPLNFKGQFQGLVAAAPSAGKAIGPLMGGFFIERLGYHSMFYLAAGLVAITLVFVILIIMIGFKKTTLY